MPALARHTVPAPVKLSIGQLTPLPSQVSCGSQMPDAALQKYNDFEGTLLAELDDGDVVEAVTTMASMI